MDSSSIAWAAGLYEGEGTCVSYTNKDGYTTIRMRIGMCDEEPIKKFAEIIGCGCVNGPYNPNRGNRKPVWFWQIEGWSTCDRVISSMWEWLSERRRNQYADIVISANRLELAA